MTATKINTNGINEIDLEFEGTTSASITSPGVVTVENTLPIATVSTTGVVKPDGSTITIASDGTITSVGGGGGAYLPLTGGTLSGELTISNAPSTTSSLLELTSTSGGFTYSNVQDPASNSGVWKQAVTAATSGGEVDAVGSIEFGVASPSLSGAAIKVTASSSVSGKTANVLNYRQMGVSIPAAGGTSTTGTLTLTVPTPTTTDTTQASGNITINATATDTTYSVTSMQVYKDGATSATYEVSGSTLAFTDSGITGEHVYAIKAWDSHGTSTVVHVTVGFGPDLSAIDTFDYNISFYIPAATMPQLQALEFDPDFFTGSERIFISTQWHPGTGEWRLWDTLGNAWVSAPTPAYTPSLATDVWHTLEIKGHLSFTSGEYFYDSMLLDGSVLYGAIATTYYQKADSTATACQMEMQIDLNTSATTAIMYYDNLSLTVSGSGSGQATLRFDMLPQDGCQAIYSGNGSGGNYAVSFDSSLDVNGPGVFLSNLGLGYEAGFTDTSNLGAFLHCPSAGNLSIQGTTTAASDVAVTQYGTFEATTSVTSPTINATSGFEVGGTALASTNLSDSSALARLASPTFTGTPTAPTATAGTNTTQIATTAFVEAAVSGGGGMTYPGAGVPNSTGSAWGTSYGTTGSGNVVLSASPTFTGTVTASSATISGNLVLGTSGTDNYIEVLPSSVGASIFYIDNISNSLRISNGSTPGGHPLQYTSGGVLFAATSVEAPVINATSGFQVGGSALASTNLSDSGNLARTVASGTAALGTSAIAAGASATVVSVAASGVLSTDSILADFNGDPTGTTGYMPSTFGGLTIVKYATAGYVNFKVVNFTNYTVTPGAITLNWRVVR